MPVIHFIVQLLQCVILNFWDSAAHTAEHITRAAVSDILSEYGLSDTDTDKKDGYRQ